MAENEDLSTFTFVSRYDVLPLISDPACPYQCEGTGLIPIQASEEHPLLRVLWFLAEAQHPEPDGWHFVPCPGCKPTDRLVALARRLMGREEA